MLCNCFPFWNSRGQWFAGAAALFKHRDLKFLFHQHILSADSAWATHKRVANPDSYPLSQEECMLILTRGQRSQPRSELLSGPTRWWEADRIQSSQREQQRKEEVSALESEGGCASSAMCFLNIVKWRFGRDQTPQVANVLISSSSLCAQHSSRSFDEWTNLVLTVSRLWESAIWYFPILQMGKVRQKKPHFTSLYLIYLGSGR